MVIPFEPHRKQKVLVNFHSCTMHIDIIEVSYLPTDAQ
jgi:hypothetical protein